MARRGGAARAEQAQHAVELGSACGLETWMHTRTPCVADRPIEIVWPLELTLDTRGDFWRLVTSIYEQRPGRCVRLDLTCCSYLSEEGLAALVVLWRMARRHGAHLHVRACGQPRHRLETAGLADWLS